GRRRARRAREPQQEERELPLGIAVRLERLEAVAPGAPRDLLGTELPADLGPNELAARQAEGAPDLRKRDRRAVAEARVDLDALEHLVVARDVLDRVEVETGVELAVHAREEVPRERGGDAGRVV